MVGKNNEKYNSICSSDEISQSKNIFTVEYFKPSSTPITNEDRENLSDSILEFYFKNFIIEFAYPCIDDMIPEKINMSNKPEDL